MDSTLQLKCPNCGASIGFNAEKQQFVCEYCDSAFSEEEINDANAREADEAVDAADSMEFTEHTNLYICESCGAEIVTDENTAASFCHYCHNAVTLKGRVTGALQPELIIPFKYSRDLAENAFHSWCAKKWFLPGDFTSKGQLEKMVGLYVPFWLADCDIDAEMNCEAHIVNSYRSGNYRITHTKIFNVDRAAKMDYMGVPADGSKKLEDKLMDSLEPFDYKEFVPFSMNYFSGYYADKYDVDKAAALPRIKSRIGSGAEQVLRDSIKGYTSVSPRYKNLRITKTKWHYAMLPVWFMTYIHGGKKYFFALNGQTGKIAGIPPVSGAKLALLAAALFILFGVLGGLIGGGML